MASQECIIHPSKLDYLEGALLTEREVKVLNFVQQFLDEHGYSPSHPEIQEGCTLASVSVQQTVNSLVEKGYLLRGPKQSNRTIRPTQKRVE